MLEISWWKKNPSVFIVFLISSGFSLQKKATRELPTAATSVLFDTFWHIFKCLSDCLVCVLCAREFQIRRDYHILVTHLMVRLVVVVVVYGCWLEMDSFRVCANLRQYGVLIETGQSSLVWLTDGR